MHDSTPIPAVVPVIEPGSFLTLHYRLAAPGGADFINTFHEKPATLSLGTGQLSPAIEARLLGLAEGMRTSVVLAPGEAFGPHNPDLVQWVAGKLLDELGADAQCQVGDAMQFPGPDGLGSYAGVVQEIKIDESGKRSVLFDFNHPLAGQAVEFEVQVIGVL